MKTIAGVPVIQPGVPHEESLTAATTSTARPAAEAGTVVVYPGGATFSTITEALASIASAGPDDPYNVIVGAGTYNERVTLKEYVNLEGAGVGQTILQSPPTSMQNSAVVTAAANASLRGFTVSCAGGTWGDFATALLCTAASPFTLAECALTVDDQGNAGLNLVAMQVDLLSQTPSLLEIVDCSIQATAGNSQSIATAVQTWNKAVVKIQPGTKISATGGEQNFGVIAPMTGSVELQYAYVEGSTWSLYKPNSSASVTAIHCQLVGPVSNGVTVIDDATSAPGS